MVTSALTATVSWTVDPWEGDVIETISWPGSWAETGRVATRPRIAMRAAASPRGRRVREPLVITLVSVLVFLRKVGAGNLRYGNGGPGGDRSAAVLPG